MSTMFLYSVNDRGNEPLIPRNKTNSEMDIIIRDIEYKMLFTEFSGKFSLMFNECIKEFLFILQQQGGQIFCCLANN